MDLPLQLFTKPSLENCCNRHISPIFSLLAQPLREVTLRFRIDRSVRESIPRQDPPTSFNYARILMFRSRKLNVIGSASSVAEALETSSKLRRIRSLIAMSRKFQEQRHFLLQILIGVSFSGFCSSALNGQTFNINTGAGSWNTNANWTPATFPNGVGASATFNNATATSSVSLNSAITVGSLNFTQNNSIIRTIANGTGGSLIFDAVGSNDATITVNGTSTLTNNVTINASITLNDTLRFTNNNVSGTGSATATITGAITGTGGFIKDGAGRVSITGAAAKNYTGATIINEGRLRFTDSGVVTGTSAITVNSGGSLYLDNANGNFTFGSAGITINGNGTAEATGQGALRNQGSNTSTLNNLVTLGSNATIHVDGSSTSTLTLASGLAGIAATTLTKSGGGTLSLTNANVSLDSATVVTNGTINASAASRIGSGSLSFAQTTANNAAVTLSNATQSIAGLSTTWADSTGSQSQRLTLNGTALTINQSTNTTFGNGAVSTLVGSVAGTGSIIKTGSGTLTFTGANTYSGGTTVNAGVLVVSSSGSLASGSALIVGSAGTAEFANAGQNLGAVSNANTATNALNFSATTGIVTLASLTGSGNTRFGSAGTVTGGISGGTVTSAGALNADVSGTANVTAGELLTGAISGGTVSANSLSSTSITGGTNNIIGAASITTLNGGTTTVGGVATIGTLTSGTANLNGATSSITTLNGGTVNLGTTILSVESGSMAGSITGASGSLVKSSTGTLTLSGANSYGGATNVTEGKLVVNGNDSAATGTVTVSGGATLGGSGTIRGATIINGVHSPGNSPGLQTFTSGLTYNTGSSLTWELIEDTLGVRGTHFDGIDVTGGTLTINSGVTSNLVFNGAGSLVNWGDDFWNVDRQWLVFDNANAPSLSPGSIFGTINVSADGASNSFASIRAGASFSWSQSGNDLFLNYHSITAVPEPSSLALIGVVFASAAFVRRRKLSV